MDPTSQSHSQKCLLTATLLLYTGCALSQVHVPLGPLLRVEGSAVSLWCNVSGLAGGIFEWSLVPAHSPRQRLQIVSSVDPDFSYALYRDRMRIRKEVFLEKVRNDSTRLHLSGLQAQDAGDYECYAPNTPHSYYGSHSATVRLIVIPDTLRVCLLSPEELSLHEDASVTLTCEVLSGSAPHTHVSITWYRGVMESAQPIATFTKHSITSVAAAFVARHRARDLRLEKVTATRYQLTLSALRSGDDGQYHCQATEWIQDPNHSWYPLTSKRSRPTAVHIHSAGPVSGVLRSSAQSWGAGGTFCLLLQLLLVAGASH